MSKPPLSAYIALTIGIIIIGFSAIFIRLSDAPGTVSAFYRMAIGTAVMTGPFFYAVRTGQISLLRQGLGFAILGGVSLGMDLALWSTGVMMSGASNPTLLANTAPLWVGVGALLFFHERQSWHFWFGLLLTSAGAMVVLGQDLLQAANIGLGTFLGLLAGIFYAAFILAAQQGRRFLNTLAYFYVSTLSSTVLLLVINLILRQPFAGYAPITYLVFLVLGIGVQVFGWLSLNYAQGYLPASLVSPTLLVQPVITAILAGLLLGETFTFWQIAGGCMVLLGIYIVHRIRRI